MGGLANARLVKDPGFDDVYVGIGARTASGSFSSPLTHPRAPSPTTARIVEGGDADGVE